VGIRGLASRIRVLRSEVSRGREFLTATALVAIGSVIVRVYLRWRTSGLLLAGTGAIPASGASAIVFS
jgi:hypothetical protein